MTPRNDGPSITSMIQWTYWPSPPAERSPLYATAIVLLATAFVDHYSRLTTGAAAFLVFWPLSYLLAAPLVRLTLYAATTRSPAFQRPGLRRTLFIIASILWSVSLLAYVLTPAIDALDFLLFLVTPLSAALLVGIPIAIAKITGTGPGTRNYVNEAHGWIGEIHAWLQTFPLFQAPPHQTHQEQQTPEDEWIEPDEQTEPNAREDQGPGSGTQDIPWNPSWNKTPPPEPEPDTYPWACQILGVSETATYKEAQEAYRKLANEHHPDRATSPTESIKREETVTRINHAWGVIKEHYRAP